MPTPPPPKETRWKPGQSGNPGGMAVGTRNKLNADFLNQLAKDFQKHGKEAIEATREKHPDAYVKVMAGLLPKQVEQTRPMDDLNDADILALLEYLRGRIAQNAGSGAVAPSEPAKIN